MANNPTYNTKEWDKIFDHMIDSVSTKLVDDINDYLLAYFKNAFNIKSFNNVPWKRSRMNDNTLIESGDLKKSIKTVSKSLQEIHIESDTPYSAIHNYGGRIKITEKMRKFFWAKFYSTGNDAWKGMALTKKKHITIPQRQYIGKTPEMMKQIEQIIINTIIPKK